MDLDIANVINCTTTTTTTTNDNDNDIEGHGSGAPARWVRGCPAAVGLSEEPDDDYELFLC